uniref:CSON010193 protein n=1 Tax=Culicoides sonorensis TaxID=179676 RepID=A0A336LL15_CULSO
MSYIYRTIVAFCVTFAIIEAAQQPSQFRPPVRDDSSSELEDDLSVEAATPNQYRIKARTNSNQYEYSDEEEGPAYTRHEVKQQQHSISQNNKRQNLRKQQYEEELADEEDKPDRLQELLQHSSFHCNDRVTGYYADDTVGCEVFHYCQDNTKHSWVCPEGFTFHQVHLICMPPSAENICDQSSKYHVVNEYLYKPLNMEEHQRKPNVTLRYSERYYPENIYYDDRRDYAEDREQAREQARIQNPSPQRKQPVHQHVSTPAPYRQPQYQQNHNAFRSPEDINISLQQRRPTVQQNRYEEEEDYSYEK